MRRLTRPSRRCRRASRPGRSRRARPGQAPDRSSRRPGTAPCSSRRGSDRLRVCGACAAAAAAACDAARAAAASFRRLEILGAGRRLVEQRLLLAEKTLQIGKSRSSRRPRWKGRCRSGSGLRRASPSPTSPDATQLAALLGVRCDDAVQIGHLHADWPGRLTAARWRKARASRRLLYSATMCESRCATRLSACASSELNRSGPAATFIDTAWPSAASEVS